MKEKFIEFYVNKFNQIKPAEVIDVGFLPMIIKRRLSRIDKGVVYLLNKTISENTKNLVFSSQTGEFDRLIKIIEQYTSEKEVSPNTFSGSVHNYPAGIFLLNYTKTIPYTALSAGNNSISAGIEAAVISKENTMFCYADVYNDELIAFAFDITKTGTHKDKYKFIIRNNTKKNDSYKNYIEFFSGKRNKIDSDIFSIEK